MKLSALLIIVGMLQVSASVYSQHTKISFSYDDKSVKEVLADIENNTDFRFFYNVNFVDLDRKVSMKGTDQTIEQILTSLLAKTNAKFKVLENNLIVIAPSELMQQKVVTGKVTDMKSGEPLAGVNVVVKGTTVGAITDINGNYSITLPSANATLVFSYMGYQTIEKAVSESGILDVVLEEETKELSEIVVIGYGTRQKKDITTAISTISTKDIENLSSSTAELAMQGKMAGVQIISGGNTPTARPTIRIRGLNTWQTANPLYVIDGVPVTEYGSGAESSDPKVQDLRSPVNTMAMINPDDIESISVLKDASAAAIYGVRAANGVILITTKKGQKGKAMVEYSTSMGWQNLPKKWDVLNTRQMIDFYRGSIAEAQKYDNTITLPGVLDPNASDHLKDTVHSYDWQTPYLNKNATIVSHQLRVSGGTDNVNYYVSGGYDYDESPFIQNSLKRYSLVTNLSAKISKYFNTGISMRVSYTNALDNNSYGGGRNDLQSMARIPAWQPIYDPSGASYLNGYAPSMGISWGGTLDGIPPKYWGFTATKLWGPQTCTNPFGMMSTQNQTYKLLRDMGTMFVELTPVEGLSIRGTVSADWYTNLRSQFGSIYQEYFSITPTDPTSYSFPLDSTISTLGTYGERQVRNTNLVYNATVHYAKSFGNHNLDFIFDYMNQNYRVDFTDGSTNWVRGIKPEFWMVQGPQGRVFGFTGWDKSALDGYMGRVSYDYNSKYYVAFTLRRDGTSKFAPEKRWGTFPAVSAAWRISSEPFMKGISFVNDLKLRMGWGQLGNQETRSFPYISSVNEYAKITFGPSPNGQGILYYGFSFPDFPNKDVIWERTTSYNLAIDAILLNNIDFTIEYYNKFTDGILQDTRLPGSVGSWNPPVVNVGQVRNSGFEFSLTYRGSIGELSYIINGNLTTNKNKVEKLFQGSPLGGQYDRIKEGMPIRYLWGLQLGGILQDTTQVNAYKHSVTSGGYSDIRPGDMWFNDQNKDSILNDKDYVYLGKTLPGFFYGLNLNLMYKGFDLGVSFTGVGDVQGYNSSRAALEASGDVGINLSSAVLNSWTPQNHSTTMPRAVYLDPAGNGRFSSRYVESAAYCRLSNLELGYTVPKLVFDRLKFAHALRVYVAGSNLLLITKWKGLDPENDGFPIPRIWKMGLKATF